MTGETDTEPTESGTGTDIEEFVRMPDEVDDETAERLEEEADAEQDMRGEMCPYPQVEAQRALDGMDSGEVVVQVTDHVPSTENVPKAVEDTADAVVWRSGDGLYKIFLRKR